MSHSANETTNDKWTGTDVSGSLSEQQSRNNSGSKSKNGVAVMHLCLADVIKRRRFFSGVWFNVFSVSFCFSNRLKIFLICIPYLNLRNDNHSNFQRTVNVSWGRATFSRVLPKPWRIIRPCFLFSKFEKEIRQNNNNNSPGSTLEMSPHQVALVSPGSNTRDW